MLDSGFGETIHAFVESHFPWSAIIGSALSLFGYADTPQVVDPRSLLTLRATILLPNGSPAAGTIVTKRAHVNLGFQSITATADDDGKIEIGDPLTVGLEPAVPHQVMVTSDGETIEGVRHFRSMLESIRNHLSSTEIDQLIESLSNAD